MMSSWPYVSRDLYRLRSADWGMVLHQFPFPFHLERHMWEAFDENGMPNDV